MSRYVKGESGANHDSEIEKARGLIDKLHRDSELRPIYDLLVGYASNQAHTAPLKLVVGFMDNNVFPVSIYMDQDYLLYYVKYHVAPNDKSTPSVSHRINGICRIFSFCQQRADCLDPMFSKFLCLLNESDEHTPSARLKLPSALRDRFCSPLGGAYMAHIWRELYFGLPDTYEITSSYERKELAEEKNTSASKRMREVAQTGFCLAMGRFYDSFLDSFIERYWDFGGYEDAHVVCTEEIAFHEAVIAGLSAVEDAE